MGRSEGTYTSIVHCKGRGLVIAVFCWKNDFYSRFKMVGEKYYLQATPRRAGDIDGVFWSRRPNGAAQPKPRNIMERISADVYKKIDNNVYNATGDSLVETRYSLTPAKNLN